MSDQPDHPADDSGASKRVTMQDVAELAGVGVATVDRVVNQRAPVRQDTARRVLAAAEQLGFRATRVIRNNLETREPPRQLGFLLQKKSTLFYRLLGQALKEACGRYPHVSAQILFLDELGPRAVTQGISRLTEQCDAIAVVAADHPVVNLALEQSPVPVITLLSELSSPAQAGHVGLDNRSAGRTAAWMLTRLSARPGKVGIVMGSHRYLCQELCEVSFRSYCRENAADIRLVEAVVSLEDASLAEEATLELLTANPDITGIYCAGGGVSGVIQALRDSGRRDVITVCNELTDETRDALIEGWIDCVISHPRPRLAQAAVDLMLELSNQQTPARSRIILPFELYTSENLWSEAE